MAPVEKLSPAYLSFCQRHPLLPAAGRLPLSTEKQAAYLHFTEQTLPLIYEGVSSSRFLTEADPERGGSVQSTVSERCEASVLRFREWSLTLLTHLSAKDYLRLMQIWQALFRNLADLLCVSAELLKDLSHLLLRLTSAQQQVAWLSRFLEMAPALLTLNSADLTPETGQNQSVQVKALALFLAWQAGLAIARLPALYGLKDLPQAMQDQLLAGYVFREWLDNPWLNAQTALKPTPTEPTPGSGLQEQIDTGAQPTRWQLALVKTVGGLIGWGGRFYEPPQIAWQDPQRLILQDSQNAWLLIVDAWGEHWQRVPHQQLSMASELGDWQLSRAGRLCFQDQQADFPQLKNWQQAVSTSHTLAVSLPHSLQVYLLGLQRCL